MVNKNSHLETSLEDYFKPSSYKDVPLKPSLLPPNQDALNRALMYLNHNNVVTPQHAEILLNAIVFESRLAVLGDMHERYQHVDYAPNHKPEWTPRRLGGRCAVAQIAAIQTAQNFGIPCVGFNTNKAISVKDGTAHFLTHVTLPICDSEGNINQTSFIIDPTFAQFMRDMDESEYHPLPGGALCTCEEGKALAIKLCQKGYIQAHEENMNLYFSSFSTRPLNKPALEVLDDALKRSSVSTMVCPQDIDMLKNHLPKTPPQRVFVQPSSRHLH